MITTCNNCDLCIQRNNIVNGRGQPNAKIMFIGEAPGYAEDKSGLPFVGKSGKLLRGYIHDYGMSHDSYITNIVKCRPPFNRMPMRHEIVKCYPYLADEINTINPKIVVCLGLIAANVLRGSMAITNDRKSLKYLGKSKVTIATYHPSYILRSGDTRAYDDDFAYIKSIYDSFN